jgi:uncharacterized protein (TIGR02996 family)
MSVKPAPGGPSPELAAFLEAIKESPGDDMPRLILADWLEEQGDPRGEYVRSQVLCHRLPPSDPVRRRLEEWGAERLARHQAAWQGRLPELLGGHQQFHRGLIHLAISPGGLLAAEPALLGTEDWAWVEAVTLRSLDDDDADRLARTPLLETLTELSLSQSRIGDAGLAALAASPHLRHLSVLRLGLTDVGRDGLRALARSEVASRLTVLDLGWSGTGPDGATELAASTRLRRLEVLTLNGAAVHDEGVEALAASPILDRVHALALARNYLTDAAAAALAESPHLGRLERLYLEHNPSISERGRRLLVERLPRVQCYFGGR